jgi:hypothetical protein
VTTGELIEILKSYPVDARVFICDADTGWYGGTIYHDLDKGHVILNISYPEMDHELPA